MSGSKRGEKGDSVSADHPPTPPPTHTQQSWRGSCPFPGGSHCREGAGAKGQATLTYDITNARSQDHGNVFYKLNLNVNTYTSKRFFCLFDFLKVYSVQFLSWVNI